MRRLQTIVIFIGICQVAMPDAPQGRAGSHAADNIKRSTRLLPNQLKVSPDTKKEIA